MKKAVKRSAKVLKLVKAELISSPELIQNKIAHLRAERTQSVLESTSISILALVLFIGAPSVFPEIINPYLPSSLKIMQGIIVVPSAFWVLTLVGNIVRYFKILKLQGLLSSKK